MKSEEKNLTSVIQAYIFTLATESTLIPNTRIQKFALLFVSRFVAISLYNVNVYGNCTGVRILTVIFA
jgi:hypothetical protein